MLVEICKTFDFDAAHKLPMLPDTHKCHRLHGHTYRVDIYLMGTVGSDGMVMEYGALQQIVAPVIDGMLDHRYLNDIPGLETPTTEILAQWVYDRLAPTLPLLTRITIWESSTTRATVRRVS